MSFNNTPITAKIKRTSQGGVITQPILNMGAPVKMKASSPAKRGTKTGTTKPVSTKPAAKKPYVKKGGKATGSMKDYKIGSQARSDEYTARGWKQDSTSTVTKPKVKAVSATPSVGVKEVSIKSKLDSKKETESKAPEQTRKTASIDKKQGKADKARANGNEKKAVRKEKAIKKKKARVAKRSEYQGQSKDAINPS